MLLLYLPAPRRSFPHIPLGSGLLELVPVFAFVFVSHLCPQASLSFSLCRSDLYPNLGGGSWGDTTVTDEAGVVG